MTLTREELDLILRWYVVAQHFGATDDEDEILIERIEREGLGN